MVYQSMSRYAAVSLEKLSAFHPTHIIVGAGSAGCVLANRLTEDASNRVLLIEAGPQDHWWDWRIHMPAALMYNLGSTRYNWFYKTTPQKNIENRSIYWPRGRVWGGSSSLNAMCYVRGHPMDYDRWESEGAKYWSYGNVLPYFKKAETYSHSQQPTDPYRGNNGPLYVTRGAADHPLHKAWLSCGDEHPIGYTNDMNGYRQEGIAKMDMTIKNGKRWSTASAYLRPVLDRPNLKVTSGLFCTRVLFDGNKAVGIEVVRGKDFYGSHSVSKWKREKIRTDGDVILSGGSINSPHLLLLSGIGPADQLKQFDIPVVHHLSGVGENLQDHLEVYVQQKCLKPITLYNKSSWKFPHNMIRIGMKWFYNQTGEGASSHLESGGFARSNDTVLHPDIQFHFLPSTVFDDGLAVGTCHAYQVHVGPMRSVSRGHIRLASKDPRIHPILEPNYMSDEDDWKEFRASIRLSREIFTLRPFDEYRGEELAPGKEIQSDGEIDQFIKRFVASAYHPSCSCKMGSANDRMAVVDPLTMGVYGVSNLKIVDSSIMPSIVSGNLNAPTIMIAEKAADLLKGKSLPKESPPIWIPSKNK